ETYTTNQNVVLTVAAPGVLLNDTDVDAGDTLSAVPAPDGTFAIRLGWTPVAGATGYDVKRSITGGAPYETIASNVPSAGYTDVDVRDTQLAVALVTSPAHGALVAGNDGAFTYTPDANFNGTDAFQYQAKDRIGAVSNIATVFLTVTSVNDAPVADARTITVP